MARLDHPAKEEHVEVWVNGRTGVPGEHDPAVIAELTDIALHEYALHQPRVAQPVCRICELPWPCGIRRWASGWLFGNRDAAGE